jgi:dephospho-CoA kinase|tara:strand:- start:468 stop:1151 length:684 start_codon:yes stop_codon:yes gene_type:complete
MKHFNELQEGLQDPNIFKAFFLAGGPGSGKSYVVRKTTGGTGLRVVNSDDAFESLLQKAGLSLKMPPEEEEPRDVVRDRAKKITAKRQANYIEGRIGLIIDGTGRDYDKITKQATELKQLGYDVHMIFVNTSLDVALQRNAERPRSVPESIVTKSWNDVQSNIGKFSQYFRQNFVVVDNNNATEDVFVKVFKQIKGLLKKKVRNPAAQQWVMQQMKARGITKKPKGF